MFDHATNERFTNMNWETIIEHLRGNGYDGDETLDSVKGYLNDEGLDATNIEDKDGNAVSIDELYSSRTRVKMNVSGTQLSKENAELRERLEQKETEESLGATKRARITHVHDRSEDDRQSGFKGLGEFVKSVHSACSHGGQIDDRLNKASLSSYGNEGVGADGGYLVPEEYVERIYANVFADDAIISMTDQVTTAKNSVTFVSDETTPWGSSGIQVYWTEEAGAITQSKPQLKYNTMRLHKVAALVPATEELLDDGALVDSFIANKVGEQLSYNIDDTLISGTGAGQPLGILNAGCTISQAKESGQAADTVVAANILNMYSRMLHRPGANPVWFVNHDVLPQLMNMSLNNNPLYLPSMQMADAPYGTLLGRPLVITQHCNTLGDLGDVIFADMSQYVTLSKASGINAARSMHLWFDQEVDALRFSTRIAGQPWMGSAVDSDNSAADVSPFVSLAARA